jgi:hypothetical protein
MMRFVTALNAIGSQVTAQNVLIIGCIMCIVSKHYGLDNSIGAGIIGAAINMLTQDFKKTQTDSKTGDTTQTVSSSPAPSSNTIEVTK